MSSTPRSLFEQIEKCSIENFDRGSKKSPQTLPGAPTTAQYERSVEIIRDYSKNRGSWATLVTDSIGHLRGDPRVGLRNWDDGEAVGWGREVPAERAGLQPAHRNEFEALCWLLGLMSTSVTVVWGAGCPIMQQKSPQSYRASCLAGRPITIFLARIDLR